MSHFHFPLERMSKVEVAAEWMNNCIKFDITQYAITYEMEDKYFVVLEDALNDEIASCEAGNIVH